MVTQASLEQARAILRLEGIEADELSAAIDQAVLQGRISTGQALAELNEWAKTHHSLDRFLETRIWILRSEQMEIAETIPGIKYEVALEVLGDSMRPFVQARAAERAKEKPNQAYIEYCTSIIQAIDMFRDELSPDDADMIARIFNPDDKTIGRVSGNK